jgi:hypothetical protein
MPEVFADMFDEMTYQDGMKAVSFVSDNQEAALRMAQDWINDRTKHGGIHVAGFKEVKIGKNVFVSVVVWSDAISDLRT